MLEIKDLVGLSQPLTKLIEVISSACGVRYRPIAIRAEAAARAEEIKLLGHAQNEVDTARIKAVALAEVEARKIWALPATDSIEERAFQRIEYQNQQRQGNLEAIVQHAIANLPEKASPDPLNEDWKTRFFRTSEDISTSHMQELWGRVLAGEVAKPGTFSLRTLETLRNLSSREAAAFESARYLAAEGRILKLGGDQGGLDEFGLSFEKILLLRDAGLLADGDTLLVRITLTGEETSSELVYNGQILLLELPPNLRQIDFHNYPFTEAGRELIRLIDPQPNMPYLRKLAAINSSVKFSIGPAELSRDQFQPISAT